MRTLSLVKGLPVFDLSNGEKLGEVCDLCISSDGIVEGLLLKKKNMFHKMNKIDMTNIVSFGTDGVMVSQPQDVKPIIAPPDFTISHQHKLTGKMVMSREGEKLGLIEDVYFLEELGTIVGYECTDGFFSDLKEGKRVVKTVQPPAIGKDTIIVNVDS